MWLERLQKLPSVHPWCNVVAAHQGKAYIPWCLQVFLFTVRKVFWPNGQVARACAIRPPRRGRSERKILPFVSCMLELRFLIAFCPFCRIFASLSIYVVLLYGPGIFFRGYMANLLCSLDITYMPDETRLTRSDLISAWLNAFYH
jgi:hypothetical protein